MTDERAPQYPDFKALIQKIGEFISDEQIEELLRDHMPKNLLIGASSQEIQDTAMTSLVIALLCQVKNNRSENDGN